MSAIEVRRIVIPESLDDALADDFRACVDVRNQVEADALGSWDLAVPASQLLPYYHDAYYRQYMYAATLDGRIVGRGVYGYEADDDGVVAELAVDVLPEFRRRGVGTALLDALEQTAREDGRSSLQVEAVHPALAGEVIVAETGMGSVAAASPGAVFATSRGYVLKQVTRISSFTLEGCDGRVAEQRTSAEEFAGSEYRFHSFAAPIPDAYVDGLAALVARMSTDAPHGDLDIATEVWDAARVRDWEQTETAAGNELVWGVIVHEPTGEVVAYNELAVPADRSRPVHQGDTLVHAEHRGHRLGMLVKTANIQALRRLSPESMRIETFNAEENRPMLDVNEAIGFVPRGYEGVWQRRLDAVAD